MRKFLVALLLAAIVGLSGCSWIHKVPYGEYNVGICVENGAFFMASHVDVEKKAFTVLANAKGPNSVRPVNPPLVLKFDGQAGGVLKYTDTEGNGVVLTLSDGGLSGEFLVDGAVAAKMHGHKGTLANLGSDGQVEYAFCTKDRKSNLIQ